MKYTFLLLLLFGAQAMAQVPPHQRPGYCPLVQDEDCEKLVISHLSKWDYDDEYEYNQIRNACAGNYSDQCLKTLLPLVPWYDKKDREDLVKIARSCQLTQNSCLNFIINKVPWYDKNDTEGLTAIANACTRSEVSCIQMRCNTRDYNCKRTDDLLRAAKRCYKLCNTNGHQDL